MHIRSMIPEDSAAVASLYGQLGYSSSLDAIHRRFAAIRSNPDHAVFVAAGADDAAVGVIHIQMLRLMESDAMAMIESLVVDERQRGQGIGSALVQEVERWAQERRAVTVWVRSPVRRSDAHRFYERRGYERRGTSFALRKRLSDEGERVTSQE